MLVELMVKRNLVYVNPGDLDRMDLLTTDLDTPADQLRVEVGYLITPLISTICTICYSFLCTTFLYYVSLSPSQHILSTACPCYLIPSTCIHLYAWCLIFSHVFIVFCVLLWDDGCTITAYVGSV